MILTWETNRICVVPQEALPHYIPAYSTRGSLHVRTASCFALRLKGFCADQATDRMRWEDSSAFVLLR